MAYWDLRRPDACACAMAVEAWRASWMSLPRDERLEVLDLETEAVSEMEDADEGVTRDVMAAGADESD